MATIRDPEHPELVIFDYPGGVPVVVDPQHPHLGGNMRGGDAGTDYTADLWPWLVEKYKPRTVLDVGCAEGHALRVFKALGCAVVGVEGLWQNARRCGVPVVVHDLTTGPCRVEGIDLIWCCDVVEHVEEKFLSNVLATLSQAPVLALAHGCEGDSTAGWHHVTNKSSAWWIEQLSSVGMMYHADDTAQAQTVCPRGWWKTSGKIFKRKA